MIILPIYFHTDGTSQLSDMGIEYNLSECEVRPVSFHQIAVVADYIDDSVEHKISSVFTNGFQFICALSREKVDELIKKDVD